MTKLGVTTTYEDLESLSVGQALERSVQIVPEKVCVFFKDRTMTYKELDRQSNVLASSLQTMGIELHHGNESSQRRQIQSFQSTGRLSRRSDMPRGSDSVGGEDRGIYLSSSWGNSEVGPGAGTMCPFGTPLDVRKRSVGLPIPEMEIKVIDQVTGEQVGTHEVGEMMVRGPNVLKGYWQNPAETDKQLEKDGWLHTGDLVSVDDSGYVAMYGRSKDLINRGGLKIYPVEIESLILQHPRVEQACVVGTPNPVLGESICAVVVPRGGSSISLAEIRDFMKDKVAKHKLPDELSIVSDFPRVPGGIKIKKFGAGGVQELASHDKNRQKIR